MKFLRIKIPARRPSSKQRIEPPSQPLIEVEREVYRLPGSLSESGILEFQFHLQAGSLQPDRDRVFIRADQHYSPTELANAFRLWLLEVMTAADPLPYDFEIRGYDTDPADEED